MKNNFLSILLTALLMLVGQSLWAYDAYIDGIYYNFSGTEATVTYRSTSYNSYSGNVWAGKPNVSFKQRGKNELNIWK